MVAGGSWEEVYPPQALHDYAMLADGERGALVGPRGEIAWMCAPRWDDEPVFGSLLGAGLCAVTPIGQRYVWGGYYEEGSLIWRSRWMMTSALVESREALVRPADPDAAVVLRRLVGIEGEARLRFVLDPRVGGGSEGMRDLRVDGGVWSARLGELTVRCSGVPDARIEDGALVAQIEIASGGEHDLVVELGRRPPDSPLPSPALSWRATERAWHQDIPAADGLWARRDVRLAYAVLAGMTSASGGMVAAATRSLPERADRGRDYDYRFAWVRDQAMVGQAVAALGPHRLMAGAVDFVADRLCEDGSSLRPAYTVDGGRVPEQRERGLPGYPGGVDHVGNDAAEQFQLDVFGEALHLFAAAAQHGPLSRGSWRAVETAVEAIADNWWRPDGGIWELERRRWTHSRQMLVSGLDRVAALAPRGQARDWQELGGRIDDTLHRNFMHSSGRWQRAADDPGLDASLLIPVLRTTADLNEDVATRRTVRALLDDLTAEEFCYRFHHDDMPLEEAEGAFVLAGFHMAMALERLGEHELAARWFERNRAASGAPGLFSEEYDVTQRQQRGNLPQAFVHGALIEASALLSR